MKNSVVTILLLLSFGMFAQEEEAILHFNDGTDLEGYGMIKGVGVIGDKEVIKFRISSDGKADIWDSSMVDGITFTTQGQMEEFRYVKLSKVSLNPRLLKVLCIGDVMLYGDIGRSISIGGIYNVKKNKSSTYDDEESKSIDLYVRRDTEDYPTKLTGFLNWKKKTKEYFKDCAALIEKISHKEYSWNTLPELVDYYNDYCIE